MKQLLKYTPIFFSIAIALVLYSWIIAQAYGRVISVESTVNGMPERLARIEEQITFLRSQISRIEDKLDAKD